MDRPKMFEDERQTDARPPSGERSSDEWTEDLQQAAGFLTRLPVGSGLSGDLDLRRAARAFPAIGALVGAAAAAVLIICHAAGLSDLLSSLIAVAVSVAITGALHEDGLADMADGFWGAADKQRKLEIMHDSRVGTFGVVTLVLAVLMKVLALGSIAEAGAGYAAAALIGAAAISRHAMVALMATTPHARSDGMAASAGAPLPQANRTSLLVALAIGIPMLWLAGGVQAIIIGAGLALLLFLGMRELAQRHIGGHTGDVCGAMQQVTEIAVLVGLALAVGD